MYLSRRKQCWFSKEGEQKEAQYKTDASLQGNAPAQPQLSWSLMVLSSFRYGQARRKGQMLIAKLDYLQYIVVRGFVSSIGARTKALWRSVHSANQAKQEAKDSSTAGKL